MDFGLDDTQRAVAELAADVLAQEADAEAREFDEPAWAALAKVGLLSLALPADLGGDGLGVGEIAVLLTEVGRRAAAVPALATLALGVLPVAAYGTATQRAALLPDAAAGTSLLTGAPSEPGAPLTSTPSTKATRARGSWRLTGTKAAVPYAAQASRVLVPATTADGPGVFVVDPHGDGVELHRTPTAAGGPEFTVRLDRAQADPLGSAPSVSAAAALRAYALVGAAAAGDGLLSGGLELTTEHVRSRQQFGRPLATFQAVAQQVADVYVAARTVHLAAVSAAWRLAAGLDADEELELAGYWLAAEGLAAMRVCHHLHGGVGVDVSYPLHRHYSQLKDLSRFVGGAPGRLEALGAACTSS